LLSGKMKVREIKDEIVEEFEVTPQQAEKDLIEYLQQLKEIEAIIEG
ncbi:unnamed protein product, partial [marine sediment metagenome]